MSVMRLKRFTKVGVLQGIGRPRLEQFFERFQGQCPALALPPASASDEEYFQGVAKALLAPEGLPAELGEALYLVDEMSNDEGHERLQAAARQAGLPLSAEGEQTQAELALAVFLADPKVLEAAHREQKLVRLTAFEYYPSRQPVNRSQTFQPPTPEACAVLAHGLDEWFAEHHRGRRTARVEVHPMDGEYFFIIRHGHTFVRTAAVNEQQTALVHFRPEQDDVVVYGPELDELRVRAGTKGERELYRQQFGRWLFGAEDYFCRRKAYTLEPLRRSGPDALAVEGCGDLERVVLREFEVAFDNGLEEVLVRKATDIFAAGADQPLPWEAIPRAGRLVRAGFELHFAGQPKPRKAQIRTPNLLKLGRHCDAQAVQLWLAKRGFRVGVDGDAWSVVRDE